MTGSKHDEEDPPLYTETYYPPWFFPYTVTVTKTTVSFGYYFRLFTKTVDRSSQSNVRIDQAIPLENVKGLREWGGWGIRLRRHQGHWETGYIAKNGGAVLIRLKNHANGTESYYAFTCSEPQKVCDILDSEKSKIS